MQGVAAASEFAVIEARKAIVSNRLIIVFLLYSDHGCHVSIENRHSRAVTPYTVRRDCSLAAAIIAFSKTGTLENSVDLSKKKSAPALAHFSRYWGNE